MRRAALLPVLVLLAVVPALAAPAGAGPDRSPPVEVDGNDALARLQGVRTEDGIVAADLVAAHVRDPDPTLRRAALAAAGRLAVRRRDLHVGARAALNAPDPETRTAALAALGRIGGGDDVPVLLAALEGQDGPVRSAGFRALGLLTGRTLPASPRRCAMWWQDTGARLRNDLHDAILALDASVTAEATAEPEALLDPLLREGWADVEAVEDAARRWLGAPDHRLRAAAFRIVATLRLGDLAADVESAAAYASPTDEAAAAAAVAALGLESREG